MKYPVFKRILDILGALLFLPLLLLLIIIIWPIVYFSDGGPCFYSGNRIGKNGVFFKMHKFRTMLVNAPDIRLANGDTYNSANDPRVTSIGKFLRQTSLDEIPQVINILKGEMSFIGPRPDPVDWLQKYRDKDMVILTVLPGISGYNQAYFRNSVEELQKKENDIYYVKNMSFSMDVKILFKTIAIVLKRDKVNRA